MKKLIIISLACALFSSCQNQSESTYSREAEMLAFCNALGVPTQERTRVLYIPYSKCSACQLSSKAIYSDTTSLLYVIHFNDWQGKIENEKFIYKNFGDYYPSDFGIITPYPILFQFYEDKIEKFEPILN